MPENNREPKLLPATIASLRQRRDKRLDYEFLPATIEVLDCPPAPFSRGILLAIVLFACSAIGWACLAKMDIVVNAMGVVIPKDKVKVVQPLEPGIVTAIHVRDGQLVQQGDSLISMDNTESLADTTTLQQELTRTELTMLRLNAELQGDLSLFSPPAAGDPHTIALHRRLLEQSVTAQGERQETMETDIRRCVAEREAILSNLKRLSEALPLSRELYEKKTLLAERKLISNADLLQAQIEISDAEHNLLTARSNLQEVEARLQRTREEKNVVEAEYRRDLLAQLAEARSSKESVGYQLDKARNRQTQCELKAPATGIVQQLAISTVGGVVTAAQPLLVIVPTEGGLEIEAKVLNKDIGFITPNQPVSVKVTAFPFTRYGDLPGNIEWVARDAVIDQEMGPSYPIRISLQGDRLPNVINGRQGVISPGMTVTADVKVGERRVIDYFLGPILRYKDQSLKEI